MREIKLRCWHEFGKSVKPPIAGMLYDDKPGDCLVWKNQGQRIIDIMQYTGLHDKNSKEIYEGDVVKEGDEIGHIEYYLNRFIVKGQKGIVWYPSEITEVIGNIYENPDLA